MLAWSKTAVQGAGLWEGSVQPAQGGGACPRLRTSKVHFGLRGIGTVEGQLKQPSGNVDFVLPAAIRCGPRVGSTPGSGQMLGRGELSAEHRRPRGGAAGGEGVGQDGRGRRGHASLAWGGLWTLTGLTWERQGRRRS